MASFVVVDAAAKVMTCPQCGQRVQMKQTPGGYVCPLCGYRSGGSEHTEGRRMAPTHSDVGRLLREAAAAPSYTEQARLIGEAEQARTEIATTARAAQEVDLARAVVEERLTPVRVHEHHTAATDWIGEVDTAAPETALREIVAQGSVWYARLPEIVKSHPDELAQQALGMGRRLAGRYGSGADAAEEAFLDHVGTLHARDVSTGLVTLAASGLPQVGDQGAEEVGLRGPDTGEPAWLPGAATSSERAPAMQELEANTSAGSSGGDSWPSPLELPQQDVDAVNGDAGTQRVAHRVRAAGEGVDNPDEIHRALIQTPLADVEANYQRLADEHPDHDLTRLLRDHLEIRKNFGTAFLPGGPLPRFSSKGAQMQTATCLSCGGHGRVAVRREGASGLDQIDQVVDPHDNPKVTPYPTAKAFPWEMPDDSSEAIAEAEKQLAEREQRKGASRRQASSYDPQGRPKCSRCGRVVTEENRSVGSPHTHADCSAARQQRAAAAAQRAAEQVYRRVLAGQDDSGWAGDMGAGGVGPGEQDGGNPGNTYPGNIADPDPVYGFGGDNGDQPLKPYGSDEADDFTNNPGINYQPGQPIQDDLGGRVNQVGQATGRRRSDGDPLIQQHLAFIRHRRALLDAG